MIQPEDRVSRGTLTAKEAAKRAGMSVRSAQRWTSRTRQQWLCEMAEEREAIRAYKYDEGHTWGETSRHFGLAKITCQKRARRARREREEEARQAALGPTLFEAMPDNDNQGHQPHNGGAAAFP